MNTLSISKCTTRQTRTVRLCNTNCRGIEKFRDYFKITLWLTKILVSGVL